MREVIIMAKTQKTSRKTGTRTAAKTAAKTAGKTAKKTRKKTAKNTARKTRKAAGRQRIDTGADERLVRRGAQGRFKESDDVRRAAARDPRTKAKTAAKRGQGDRGDRKR